MKDVNTLLNDQMLRNHERIRTLSVIKNELKNTKLVAPARMFIAKTKAKVFQNNKSSGFREIYLFTDMLFSAQHSKIRGLVKKQTIRFQRNGLQAFQSDNDNDFELVLAFDSESFDARDLMSSWKDLSTNDNQLVLHFKTFREKETFLKAVQKLELTEFAVEKRLTSRTNSLFPNYNLHPGKLTM